jgi:hypothetical protein
MAAGRQQVAPGGIIASNWGNLVWDQSVQVFASTVDRDAQFPTPNDGALTYLEDADVFEGRVAGAWKRFTPAMLSGLNAASANQNCTTTLTDVAGMSTTLTVASTASVFMCQAVFDFQNSGTGSGTAQGAIVINGTVMATQAFFGQDGQAANQRATVCCQARITGLPVGARIWKGQIAMSQAGGNYRINTPHSTIAVWQVA